jgi:polygalacturonase
MRARGLAIRRIMRFEDRRVVRRLSALLPLALATVLGERLLVAAAHAAAAPAPSVQPFPAGRFLDVRAYGARGDGVAKDTEAIQGAIHAAANQGGGTVFFGPGKYLSGTLVLRSNVILELGPGAVLLGSTDAADFPRTAPAFRWFTETYVCQSLIYAEREHDIGIRGAGTIDGQGAAFAGKPYRERPYLIRFVSCTRPTVQDITLRDSPMWVQHYLDCDEVAIRGITVHSHANANNDMVDIDCCRNVRISDCLADSGDDAITLKSTGGRPCENVAITNCVLFSTCNAIKCGTGSNGGFKNIVISDCAIAPPTWAEPSSGRTMLAGIALEIVDGGTLDRVAISNVTMTGVRVPIFLRLGNRARPIHQGAEKPGMGTFQNVSIANVVAEATERIGCSIAGLPGHPIQNVTLSNIRLLLPGAGTAEEASREAPEKAEAYPECTMFGVLPAYGFFCRHVEGLTFDNVTVAWKNRDARPALVCDDVRNLTIHGFTAPASVEGPPFIRLRNASDALIHGCVAPPETVAFLRIEGASASIPCLSNDLVHARTPFDFEAGMMSPDREKVLYQAANRLKSLSE